MCNFVYPDADVIKVTSGATMTTNDDEKMSEV